MDATFINRVYTEDDSTGLVEVDYCGMGVMLVTFQSKINKVSLENNVAYFHTATIHEFTEGQSVVITSVGAPFNGTHTVTDDLIGPYVFTAAITNADVLEKNIIPAGNAALSGASTYVGNANVEAAVLATCSSSNCWISAITLSIDTTEVSAFAPSNCATNSAFFILSFFLIKLREYSLTSYT